MKAWLWIFLLAGEAAWGLNGFPDGRYEGQGERREGGKRISFKASMVFRNNTFEEIYQSRNDRQVIRGQVSFHPGNFFTVTLDGFFEGVGGYCGNQWCQLRWRGPGGASFEETLAFVGDRLYKLGTEKLPGRKVVWESEFRRVSR